MAQSDYIKHLKLATEIKQQKELTPVLSSKNYTLFKEYTITNTVKNTATLNNDVPVPGITDVFDVQLSNVSNCPTFIECQRTNTRPNRVPLKAVYITPRPIPLYVKQRANTSCSACCYDTSINGPNNKKFNFFNTNFTTFANYRMRKMACNCKTL
jgi:hypothetical protein